MEGQFWGVGPGTSNPDLLPRLFPRAMSLRGLLCLFLFFLLAGGCVTPTTQPAPRWMVPERDAGENLFREAEEAYRSQKYRLAEEKLTAYLERYPQGAKALQARLRQAELLGLLGDWQGALAKYQALLQKGVEAETALRCRYGIGRAYYQLGRYGQASEVLESLTASSLPAQLRFSTYALLAEVDLKKGEVATAFAHLRLAARDLAAGDAEWFEDLKTRLVAQATPVEMEHLANLYRDSPLTVAFLVRLARLAQEQGRTEEARQWLTTLKERFPDSKEAQTAPALLAPTKPVLGCLLPQSGDYSDLGRRVQQGMELAAREAPLELVYRDCANQPEVTARTVKELAQDPRVLALLGPLTSADAQAASQAAQTAGITLIGLSQKLDFTGGGPFIFQAFLTPRQQVRALLRYTLGTRGLKHYAVLAPDSPYGRILTQIFREELEIQGGSLVTQASYPPGTQELEEALTSLWGTSQSGSKGPPAFEALFVPDDAATVAAIATHLAGKPWPRVQLLGTNLANPEHDSEETARALEGILFPEAFYPGDPNPAVQAFVTAYRQRYGQEPDYLALQGYMVVRLMAHLLERQGPLSREELPQKLRFLGGVPHLPWFRGFNPERQAELALYILTVKDGRAVLESAPAPGQP